MGEATARQGSQQMLHRRHPAMAEVQGGAQRAVAHLIRAELDRLGVVLKTQMKTGAFAGGEAHSGFFTAVQTDTPPLHIGSEGPGARVILGPVRH